MLSKETINPKSPPKAKIKNVSMLSPGFVVEELDIEKIGVGPTPFEMSIFEVLDGHMSAPEEHDDAEIWVVLQGKGIVEVSGHEFEVAPNDVVLLNPGQVHSVRPLHSSKIRLCSIWWT